MFQRIAFSAGVAGLLAALLLSVLQSLWLTPLILQAETYEVQTQAPVLAEHHDHGREEAWPRQLAGRAPCRPSVAIWWWPWALA